MIVQHDAMSHVTSSLGFDDDVVMILEYDSQDPYAIYLRFEYVGPLWHLDRSIIADALTSDRLQGLSDVKARREGSKIEIYLDSPEGTAVVKIDALVVSAFLQEIYTLVPEDEAAKISEDQMEIFLSEFMIADED